MATNPAVDPREASEASEDLSPAFREALAAYNRGWSVIPCTKDKRPDSALIKAATGKPGWGQFKKRRATLEELWSWRDAEAFGVVNGPISGLLVLDVDPRNGGLESLKALHLPPTPVADTPSGGFHAYYAYPGDFREGNPYPGLEIKGQLVLPGPEGRSWQSYLNPENVERSEPPAWLRDWLKRAEKPKPKISRKVAPSLGLPGIEREEVPSNPYALLGTPSLSPCPPLSLKGEFLSEYFKDEGSVRAMMAAMGRPDLPAIGSGFRDLLPGDADKRPSASLWRNRSRVFVYRSWRYRDSHMTLGEVRASLAYGHPVRLTRGDSSELKPEAAVWSIRLLIEAGLVAPAKVRYPKLPTDPPEDAPEAVSWPVVRRVYAGFIHLLECKWLHTPNAPTVFSRRFAAPWCGVGERQAGAAIKWLYRDYLDKVDTRGNYSLLLPGNGPQGKREERQRHNFKAAGDVVRLVIRQEEEARHGSG